jgi:hypothetical protein
MPADDHDSNTTMVTHGGAGQRAYTPQYSNTATGNATIAANPAIQQQFFRVCFLIESRQSCPCGYKRNNGSGCARFFNDWTYICLFPTPIRYH